MDKNQQMLALLTHPSKNIDDRRGQPGWYSEGNIWLNNLLRGEPPTSTRANYWAYPGTFDSFNSQLMSKSDLAGSVEDAKRRAAITQAFRAQNPDFNFDELQITPQNGR